MSLVIITEIPGAGLVAVLRERGHFNFKSWMPQSWPGGYQVTVHSKLLPGDENPDYALERQMEEELGYEFTYSFWREYSKDVIQHLCTNKDGVTIQTFLVCVQSDILAQIRLDPGSGRIRFVRSDEVDGIQDLTQFSKTGGVTDSSIIAMFPHEKEAVALAFKLLAH